MVADRCRPRCAGAGECGIARGIGVGLYSMSKSRSLSASWWSEAKGSVYRTGFSKASSSYGGSGGDNEALGRVLRVSSERYRGGRVARKCAGRRAASGRVGSETSEEEDLFHSECAEARRGLSWRASANADAAEEGVVAPDVEGVSTGDERVGDGMGEDERDLDETCLLDIQRSTGCGLAEPSACPCDDPAAERVRLCGRECGRDPEPARAPAAPPARGGLMSCCESFRPCDEENSECRREVTGLREDEEACALLCGGRSVCIWQSGMPPPVVPAGGPSAAVTKM